MPRLTTIFAAILIAASAALLPTALSADSTNPRQQFQDLVAATSLDHAGMAPWHLRVSFQLYDLDGKPSEKGTIEEWWISPQQHRIVITSPSYNAILPPSPDAPVVANRTAFFLSGLLHQFVHPIPQYSDLRDLDVIRSNQKLEKVELSCLSLKLSPLMQTGRSAKRMGDDLYDWPGETFSPTSSFCVEPGTNVLRAQFEPSAGFYAIRDQVATFRGIEIGVDNGISFGNRLAITGHLETLETYSPKPDEVAAASAQSRPASLTPPELLAPKLDFKGGNGSALLFLAISKSGTVDSVDVIYRSNEDFAKAKVATVEKWKFHPALRDGKPVSGSISFEFGHIVTETLR